MNHHRYMLGVDLGDTIRYDPDLVEVFEQTICLIAVSGNDWIQLYLDSAQCSQMNCLHPRGGGVSATHHFPRKY